MRVLASYTCILYGNFIFRIGCLGEKKHATCTIFSAFCTKPNDPLCYKRPRQSLYINLFHFLSPKWSSHFPQLSLSLSLSLFGAGILEKKRVRVTAHYAYVNVHNSRTISWIAASGQ